MSEPSADEEDLKLLSPEERERRRQFEQRRKAHYNEFHAVKMARQLMEEEGEEDDDDEAEAGQGKTDAASKDEDDKMVDCFRIPLFGTFFRFSVILVKRIFPSIWTLLVLLSLISQQRLSDALGTKLKVRPKGSSNVLH